MPRQIRLTSWRNDSSRFWSWGVAVTELEEAFWFDEGVMLVLRERGLVEQIDQRASNVFSFR
jgi:hypothetical protein